MSCDRGCELIQSRRSQGRSVPPAQPQTLDAAYKDSHAAPFNVVIVAAASASVAQLTVTVWGV